MLLLSGINGNNYVIVNLTYTNNLYTLLCIPKKELTYLCINLTKDTRLIIYEYYGHSSIFVCLCFFSVVCIPPFQVCERPCGYEHLVRKKQNGVSLYFSMSVYPVINYTYYITFESKKEKYLLS